MTRKALAFVIIIPSLAFASEIPPGFQEHRIRSGDYLGSIALKEDWDLIRKVNRIDEFHLVIGKKILIPYDRELARTWLPIPERLTDESVSREIRIFLDQQYFGAYERGKLADWGPISSGVSGRDTPKGQFQVLWKARHYRSKKYDAEMPFAINISASGYFLHQQSLPGRRASHGCIRLLKADAHWLFEWAQKGDRVTIQ